MYAKNFSNYCKTWLSQQGHDHTNLVAKEALAVILQGLPVKRRDFNPGKF